MDVREALLYKKILGGGGVPQEQIDEIAIAIGLATPSNVENILNELDEIIANSNATTGETDTTLTDAVQSLIDGYGGGGGTVVNEYSGFFSVTSNTAILYFPISGLSLPASEGHAIIGFCLGDQSAINTARANLSSGIEFTNVAGSFNYFPRLQIGEYSQGFGDNWGPSTSIAQQLIKVTSDGFAWDYRNAQSFNSEQGGTRVFPTFRFAQGTYAYKIWEVEAWQ